VHQFDYGNDPDDVVIDLSGTSVWDASSVATLDAIRGKYASRGKAVRFTGLDEMSQDQLTRLSGRLGA
ncbi:MAG: STAS domain-containing protein, partial [Mycobacterium sp.]